MMQAADAIQQAIILGNAGSISKAVMEMLADGVTAQTILDQQLLPGMAIVGERFRLNQMFLPQVLMSAQAMQTAIDILRPQLLSGVDSKRREKVIIGTVKGDMHDIGKNLVRIMLTGAGFDVIDLGVNIPAFRFRQAVIDHNASVVCLSALLSSTMNNMREVVKTFREDAELKDTRILIGGAPVTQDFADQIGADAYAATAPAAVALMQAIFNQN